MLTYDVMPDLACIPISGTSLQGSVIITYHRLVEMLGEPTSCEPSADEKIRCEWVVEFYDEAIDEYCIATIYDWKEEKPVQWVTDWHIGGFKPDAARCIQQMISEFNAKSE